ncbi:BPSS1780 family membrane protein [Luteimonas huabeiensis]|uniref:BPSS1780 family membrane protein n=1 Tax=Luteimonas huabeiensis TaxID=1244513 RepID=UPI000463CC45|nr:BPSS1780 family membrane protein [Luteimonas huabeiensis]
MTDVRKVSASAGAEWLLGGFGLLRKAPGGLIATGLAFGLISAIPMLFVALSPALVVALQLLIVLATPVLMGGFVHAVREVDQGRAASPAHLLEGFRGGRTASLVALVVPQIAFGIVAMLLLVMMIGMEQLQALVAAMEQAQAQTTPDPALFAGLPAGRLLLWTLIVVALAVVTYFYTFVAAPQIMFEGRAAFAAMGRSFRACVRNLPAMVVFFLLLLLVAVLMGVASQLVSMVLGVFVGMLLAAWIAQIVLIAVLMPVVVGALYTAWQQVLAPAGGVPAAQSTAAGIEL